jgi:hypothetical protein
MKISNVNYKVKKQIKPLIKIVYKCYLDKSNSSSDNDINNLKDFKINFKENPTYEEYKNQMEKNIEILTNTNLKNISSSKLLELLKENGIKKTEKDIEEFSKIVSKKDVDVLNQ